MCKPPEARTQCPHPRASAWMETEALRSCSHKRKSPAEMARRPTHAPLDRKSRSSPRCPCALQHKLCRAVSTLLCSPKARGKASLPGWGPGLLCRPSGSRLALHVTVAAPALMLQHSRQQGCAARPRQKPRVPRSMAASSLRVLGGETQILLPSPKYLSCLLPSHISWWRLPFL